MVLGTIVGATFSIGLGIPFWLVGTFAVALPKGGKWMLGVKSFFGIVMAVVAFYFLKNAFPSLKALARPDTTFMVVTAFVVVVGLALGAVHLAWDDGGIGIKIRKGLGIALAVAGGALFLDELRHAPRIADLGALRGAGVRQGEEREAPDAHRLHRRLVRRLQGALEGDLRGPPRHGKGRRRELRRGQGRRDQLRRSADRSGERASTRSSGCRRS